ncbi:pullulanase-type alpha-1,6-glucosidase [Klebsiella pneumoniae]|uniref:pullulanase-type alpha-1,6-glucosidase n=1 Tax=Klebsiella pneumoniae TaxID=573 RepID=UPI000808D916|nr:pullulanase-type alpha-1,6-glucosidase [Klebsiella pneumoniae]MBN8053505.1 pullulanase-type alpha-1,6-glucosidase [Klebsiella pneumoniae]MDF7738849.1 pullulanase-type alpha-1,6-glucosidase [Klebsiella pneumoniae]UBU43556.1 pullulanase-type alpha-1,6-glucosidase [Klebsiella pneumoniae]SBX45142.1 pullulanase [Klebsiella pneumoniae]HBQ1162525.1 pullulanase-type alpha-1,6-glucosidase [Klebsiella pneumoniae]
MLRYTCHALFLGSLVLLSGCDNSSSSSTSGSPGSPGNPGNPGTPGTPDPQDVVVRLPDVAVPGEAVQASARQAVIHLVDIAGITSSTPADYATKNLYLWNNETCDALSAPVADWNDVSTTPTGSDKYGPYWVIPLNKESGCINVIVRDGTNKLIDSDLRVSFSDFTDRTVSVIAGNSAVYDSRADAFRAAFGVALADAHWVDKTTLLWPDGENKPIVRLYYSHSSKVAADSNGEFSDKYVKLTPTTVSQQVSMRFPHLASYPAFKLPDDVNVDELLQGETVAIAAESDGILSSATQVQTAGVLDDTYAAAAEALSYGAQLTDSGVTFRVWAPTAQQVELVIYSADKKVIASHPMTRDSASGAWSWQGGSDLKGAFYRYAMTVYHPQSRKVEQYEVTDPYAHSLSTNSEYSQVVDLNDSALKPEGWDGLTMPHAQKTKADLAKMTIHESHIRDLSAWDQTVPAELRGKYLALTAQESNMVQHLKQLSASGVTHIELLPVFDLATVNEFSDKVADIQQPFSRLCEINSAVKSSEFAGYCDSGSTVEEVLTQLKQNDSKDNPQVQALNTLVAQTDSYNWGYDPFHYTVPEGSYATDPEGTARIKEFRTMIQAIKQDLGMNVIMDVVYNHTNAAGPTDRTSVLDKIVPWYYQRLNETTGSVESATCCSDSAPEHRMFAKLIADSLAVWTTDYKIDGFRFDLMGYHPKAQILSAWERIKALNPDIYFFGEGWDSNQSDRFEIASQINLKGTGIGTFSDRLRDAVRGGGPFDSGDALRQNQGVGSGAGVLPNELTTLSDDQARHLADLTRLGMAGNLADFVLIDKDGAVKRGSEIDYNGAPGGYAADPTEVVNYVSKHDNQTLWDMISYKAAQEADLDTRVRMQAVSLATVMLGQGIAFDQQGSELLRSKSFTRDSYDSGDWFNRVDYSLQDNNYNVGMPRSSDDGSNYDIIARVKDAVATPGETELKQMTAFYQELTALRKSSPLFTLGDGATVMKRVDFRNTGAEQQTGLLVMTIDDGMQAGASLDSRVDGIVVAINAAPESRTLQDFAGTSLQLSAIQQAAGDRSLASGVQVAADGSVTLPAWSVAVLELPQGESQGAGLPVSSK